jgi:hypothetical protein
MSAGGRHASTRLARTAPKKESRRAVKPGGSHASAVVSGGWEYDRRASEIR